MPLRRNVATGLNAIELGGGDDICQEEISVNEAVNPNATQLFDVATQLVEVMENAHVHCRYA